MWLKSSSTITSTSNNNNRNRISNSDISRRKPSNDDDDNDDDDRNYKRISDSRRSSSSNDNRRSSNSDTRRSSNSNSNSNMNDRFSWSGPPITDDELIQKKRLQSSNDYINTNAKMSSRGSSSSSGSSNNNNNNNPRIDNEYRTTTSKYSDEPASFWPDTEEFKDMLLDESQWRINLIGDWASPFVRSETKWRYQLYKRWLQLLDEGLGDGFDVVPEAFGDEYYAYEYGDNDDDDDDEAMSNRKTTSSNRRESPSSPSSSRISQESLERRTQAKRYAEWIKERIDVDDNQWTDVSNEEMESRRLLDDDFDEKNPNINPSTSNRDDWFGEPRSDSFDDEETFKKAWEDSKSRRPLSNAEENYRRKESNSISRSSPRERSPRNRDFESDDI